MHCEAEVLRLDMQCYICMEPYNTAEKRPVFPPCHHLICQECLGRTFMFHRGGGKVCPFCRGCFYLGQCVVDKIILEALKIEEDRERQAPPVIEDVTMNCSKCGVAQDDLSRLVVAVGEVDWGRLVSNVEFRNHVLAKARCYTCARCYGSYRRVCDVIFVNRPYTKAQSQNMINRRFEGSNIDDLMILFHLLRQYENESSIPNIQLAHRRLLQSPLFKSFVVLCNRDRIKIETYLVFEKLTNLSFTWMSELMQRPMNRRDVLRPLLHSMGLWLEKLGGRRSRMGFNRTAKTRCCQIVRQLTANISKDSTVDHYATLAQFVINFLPDQTELVQELQTKGKPIMTRYAICREVRNYYRMWEIRDMLENLPPGHIRHVILNVFLKGTNASQAAANINKVYGEGATTERTCRRWFVKFRSGDRSLEDEPGRGCEPHLDNAALLRLLSEDNRQTTRELAEQLGVSHTAVVKHLADLENRRYQNHRASSSFQPNISSP